MSTYIKQTTRGDIIKIGTRDVIKGNNKESMIFGKLAMIDEGKYIGAINKAADPRWFMPRWCPSGLTWSQKRKLLHLRAKESRKKEAEKIFNDTHLQYPPPQKWWRPKAIEANQMATKTEDKIVVAGKQLGDPAAG
jgi:hypothetical protein